ncbi:MAG: type II secretion system protein GspG [Planctomycetota bacterium]
MSESGRQDPAEFPDLGADLEGLDPGLAAALEEVDEAFTLAMAGVEERMERGRAFVLDRVQVELRAQDLSQGRRLRRRHLRALFYATLLTCLSLIVAAYVGTVAAIRLQRRRAQQGAVETELRGVSNALQRYVADRGDVPQDAAALWAALATPQPSDDARPYLSLAPSRFEGALYVDDFGHAYAYRLREGSVLIYSLGPNGKDERGLGDDLGVRVVLPR